MARKRYGFAEGFQQTFIPTLDESLREELKRLTEKPRTDLQMELLKEQVGQAQLAGQTQMNEYSLGPQTRELRMQEAQAGIDLKKAQAEKARKYTNDKSINELFKLYGDLAKQAVGKVMGDPLFRFSDPLEQQHMMNVAVDMAITAAQTTGAAARGGAKQKPKTPAGSAAGESATRRQDPKTKAWWVYRGNQWQKE